MEDSEINSIPAKNQNDYLKARNNFLENIPITVFETNKQGYIIQTNKYGCDLFGYTAEEVAAGKVHFTDLISAEDVGRAVMNFQQIFNDKVLKNSEYKAKKRNGEELDILIQGEMFWLLRFINGHIQHTLKHRTCGGLTEFSGMFILWHGVRTA